MTRTWPTSVPRLHRYEVAQGFQPQALPLLARSEEAVLAEAVGHHSHG